MQKKQAQSTKRFYCQASFIYDGPTKYVGWTDKDYIVVANSKAEAQQKIWKYEKQLGAVRKHIHFTSYALYIYQKTAKGKLLR